MRIAKPVVGFSFLIVAALAAGPAARAAPFALKKDKAGLFQAFRAVRVPLDAFTKEYARVTGKAIDFGGPWSELKGSITLITHRAIPEETLTELFHQLLDDNGFGVLDAAGGKSWLIERQRDLRDHPIPVYDSGAMPDTYRMVTVVHELKHLPAEQGARILRSFMPANTRIIPSTGKQEIITADAHNIGHMLKVFEYIDTEEAGRHAAEPRPPRNACPEREQRIEKLVIEKLEIGEQPKGFTIPGQPGGPTPFPNPASIKKGGAK